MSNNSERNWWEFYGVRYAQGTVIGAMIVYFLFSQNENLGKLLFLPKEAKDFGIAHLTLLAIYGLTYCYIASAPILVFHAGRAFMFKSAINPTPYKGIYSRIPLILIIALGIPAYLAACNRFTPTQASAAGSYALMLTLQFRVVEAILRSRWSDAIKYYTTIINKRKSGKHSEYIESYRHMREHGNSFLIVIFQMLLAFPLYALACAPSFEPLDSIRNGFIILFLWTAPAAFIWAYAIKIENNLQNL